MPEYTDSKFLAGNIGKIQKAISMKRKISFQFQYYNQHKQLVPIKSERTWVSPHYVVSNNGRFYLIGGYDNGNMCVYRIDLIKDNNVREKSDTKTEIASWQTLKGEVIPVYEDFNRQGTDYKLALY